MVIWTDVDGVYSADPRVVVDAQVVPHLNYREASELSFYGAKVLHQRTMIPVAAKRIPVVTRSTFEPDRPGTLIDGRFTPGSHPVKAISAVRGQSLLSVEGKGMAGVPGVAARLFSALAQCQISVTMISQSSSESSICLAIPEGDAMRAQSALKREFRPDLSRGDIEEIVVRDHVGLIAAVGLGMARTPGIAGRVFGALGRGRINVLAIAQGSSELNVSLAVKVQHIDSAIRALHREFGLHLADTGVASPRGLDLILYGAGNIGRAVAELVLKRRTQVFDRFQLTPRIVALADRSGWLFDPQGLAWDRLSEAIAHKSSGRSIAELEGATAGRGPELLTEVLRWRLSRPILIDVTDADDSTPLFLAALGNGCDVVTANKKPLGGTWKDWHDLREGSRSQLLKAETTVGAGLPIVDTLEMLLATGDVLGRAEGCLSGTLGFVMTQLQEGVPLSAVVREAAARGFTEPDPRADLSGEDVARKALILGRLSGLLGEDAEVQLEGLVDLEAGLPFEELLSRLERDWDARIAARVAATHADGCVLRYVAEVSRGRVEVGPRSVPRDAPLAGLKGTDNMIVFRSERYDERPLVITGPGAGVGVTAMGVFGDLLRIAGERA